MDDDNDCLENGDIRFNQNLNLRTEMKKQKKAIESKNNYQTGVLNKYDDLEILEKNKKRLEVNQEGSTQIT